SLAGHGRTQFGSRTGWGDIASIIPPPSLIPIRVSPVALSFHFRNTNSGANQLISPAARQRRSYVTSQLGDLLVAVILLARPGCPNEGTRAKEGSQERCRAVSDRHSPGGRGARYTVRA